MSEDIYYTIETTSTGEFRDRGSRFMAYAFPISAKEEFKTRLAALKKEHPKAAHHCFAYRLGTDGNEFRVSDDGEPSGTAGRPILGQIDSLKITNVLVVVVRYFGGTLLGVPGLINAYKTSTALALDHCPIIQKPILVNYKLEFDYTRMNDVMRIMKQFHCEIIKNEQQLFCEMLVGIPKNNLKECQEKIEHLHGVVIKGFDYPPN